MRKEHAAAAKHNFALVSDADGTVMPSNFVRAPSFSHPDRIFVRGKCGSLFRSIPVEVSFQFAGARPKQRATKSAARDHVRNIKTD